MKNKKHLFLIIFYCLFWIVLFLGFNHLYGSNIDWLSQHSTIPDYFRSIFYETKRFIPNFVFNLGAGQNIFNYSYYGLMSPIILISYLLPFVSMNLFIQIASIILYILFGLLMYKFINDNFNNEKLSLIISLIALSISSVNFNFHHHIMFVWYLPFLVLTLIGVDRYNSSKKSDLLMIGSFLIIMTNYYYSVSSLVAIFIYGVYKILKKNDFKIILSIKRILLFGLHLVIPVLMAMFIILPTFFAIKNVGREHTGVSLIRLLIPDVKELFYDPVNFGIVGMLFLVLVSNIFIKKKDKSDLIFNIILLLFMMCPIFTFVLNGLLYPRGKVLISFIPLYLYIFSMFLDNFKKNKIHLKKIGIFLLIFIFIIFLFDNTIFINNTNSINSIFIIDIVLGFIFLYLGVKYKKSCLIVGYTFISLFVCLFYTNTLEKYIDVEYYKKINNPGINRLYDSIEDKDIYRSYNIIEPRDDANKVYTSNYYGTGIYSSTYNSLYNDFFNNYFGNNIKYRNLFITTGSDNDLFHTFMGVRYITSYDRNSFYYKKISEDNGINLYYNPDAYPLMYVSNELGNYKILDDLSFPYNMEYLMNYSVVNDGGNDYSLNIKKVDIDKDKFKFKLKKVTHKKYEIDSKYNGKIIYIKFNMNRNMQCGKGWDEDVYITINGVKNKLSCSDHIYHNKNNVFEYVIPITDSSLGLDVKLDRGEYDISDIEVYYSDKIVNKYRSVSDLKIDKANSIITGNVNILEDSYIISSIPYDEGFSVFVNDKRVKYERVNYAFLGFKIKSGNNKIEIRYNSLFYNIGKYISIGGLLILIGVIYFENIYLKSKKKGD